MQYGPKIVRSGLVLHLDAADRKSYPGSGTTWYDLSGNSRHGTLTNGPTFNSGNGGYISFDGVDDYISSPSLSLPTNSGFTMCLFLKQINNQPSGDWNFFAVGNNFEMGTYGQTNTSFMFKDNSIAIYPNEIFSDNIVNSWSYIAFGVYATTRYPFIHTYNSAGYAISTLAKSYTNGNIDFNNLFGVSSNSKYRANAGIVQVYNRALTDAEVRQNFNATRGRFGI
jgi:hypothetical protein